MRSLLVTLVVVGLLAIGGDRVAHLVATHEAEQRLAAAGFTDPSVDVPGFPFVTQLVRRRFGEVDLSTAGVTVSRGRADDLDATAHDVALSGGNRVTVGRLSAQATIGYAEVLHRVSRTGLRLRAAGNRQVELRRDVTVLGQTLAVVARGRVDARGATLRVTPTSFSLEGGGAVDARLTQTLTEQLSLHYRVRGLPAGVRIDGVTPTARGFLVQASGHDVTFTSAAA